MLPEVGDIIPERQCRRVDFPPPEGPMIEVISSPRAKEIPASGGGGAWLAGIPSREVLDL